MYTYNVSLRLIILFLLFFLFSACSSPHAAQRIKTESLSVPGSTYSLVLREKYVWVSWIREGLSVTQMLSPGIYVSEFFSEDGVFYRGKKDSVTVFSESKGYKSTPILREGGIFIPNKKDESFKIYFYQDNTYLHKNNGALVSSIVSIGDGDILISAQQPNNEELKKLIDVSVVQPTH